MEERSVAGHDDGAKSTASGGAVVRRRNAPTAKKRRKKLDEMATALGAEGTVQQGSAMENPSGNGSVHENGDAVRIVFGDPVPSLSISDDSDHLPPLPLELSSIGSSAGVSPLSSLDADDPSEQRSVAGDVTHRGDAVRMATPGDGVRRSVSAESTDSTLSDDDPAGSGGGLAKPAQHPNEHRLSFSVLPAPSLPAVVPETSPGGWNARSPERAEELSPPVERLAEQRVASPYSSEQFRDCTPPPSPTLAGVDKTRGIVNRIKDGSSRKMPPRLRVVFSGVCVTGRENVSLEPIPFPISHDICIATIACGKKHLVVVDVNKKAYSCGNGESGQLGLGEEVLSSTELRPIPVENIVGVRCGDFNTGFIQGNGHFLMCGLIFPETIYRPVTIKLEPGTKVLDAALGQKHTILLVKICQIGRSRDLSRRGTISKGYTRVVTFGSNATGALGRKTDNEEEERLPGVVKLFDDLLPVSVYAGESQCAVITDEGKLFVWGRVLSEVEPVLHPIVVKELDKVSSVVLGDSMHIVLSNGVLYSWGRGSTGTLGIGSADETRQYQRIPHIPSPLPTNIPTAAAMPALGGVTPVAQLQCVRSMAAVLVAPSIGVASEENPKQKGSRIKDIVRSISARKDSKAADSGKPAPGSVYIWGKGAFENVFEGVQSAHGVEMSEADLMIPIQWPELHMIKAIHFSAKCVYMLQHVPYFGVSLEELMKFEDGPVPWIVASVVAVLMHGDRLKTDGVFRMSGNMQEIADMMKLCNKGIVLRDLAQVHVHTLTGFMKRFLMNLPSPLIPEEDLASMAKIVAQSPIYEAIIGLREYMLSMHVTRRRVLEHILPMLHRTYTFRSFNQMNLDAISICWAPIMFGVGAGNPRGSKALIRALVRYGDVWFSGETKTLLARAAASFLKGEELQLEHLSSCLGFLNKHLGEEHSAQILRPHVLRIVERIGSFELDKDWDWIQVHEVFAVTLPPHLNAEELVQAMRDVWDYRESRELVLASLRAGLVEHDERHRERLKWLMEALKIV